MDITGTIKLIRDTKQVSEKFKLREFVLTDNNSQYPQHISFQLTQDKTSLLDKFNVGQEIKVHFNVRGKEYTDKDLNVKYFNSLEAWRLEGSTSTATGEKKEDVKHYSQPDLGATATDDSDLPF